MQNMRRLAFVIHDLNSWGGHDRSTMEIARRLSHKLPVDIYSFTLDDPKGMASWGDVRVFKVHPDFKRPIGAKVAYFSLATVPILKVIPRIKGEPVPLIHATGTCSLVSDVVQVQFVNSAWKKVRDSLPQSQDLVRAYRTRSNLSLLSAGISFYHESLLNYNIALEHWTYSRRKKYIAISESVRKELFDNFQLHEQVHVVRHGVDSSVFRPAAGLELESRSSLRRELGILPEDLVVLFIGTYERKGLALAIDSVALLGEELRKRVKLLAVGTGDSQAFLSRAVEKGIGSQMVFVNHTRNIVPYYQASDLFLLPTLYEPFGLVVLEAMACGLPVLVSRLAGGSELIEDSKSGRLIEDPKDALEVASKLEALLLNDELRAQIGRNARTVGEHRSWDMVASEYEAILGPLLDQRHRFGAGA
jgi:UDP-glucose:(heptosyl)LPS alpha-1,3-glucosyltransferase